MFVVSYVSLGRSPYRRTFIEECTGVSLCTYVVFGGYKCYHISEIWLGCNGLVCIPHCIVSSDDTQFET